MCMRVHVHEASEETPYRATLKPLALSPLMTQNHPANTMYAIQSLQCDTVDGSGNKKLSSLLLFHYIQQWMEDSIYPVAEILPVTSCFWLCGKQGQLGLLCEVKAH